MNQLSPWQLIKPYVQKVVANSNRGNRNLKLQSLLLWTEDKNTSMTKCARPGTDESVWKLWKNFHYFSAQSLVLFLLFSDGYVSILNTARLPK